MFLDSFTASSALATAFTWWSTWSFLNNHKRQFLALRQGKLKIPEDCTPQLQLTGTFQLSLIFVTNSIKDRLNFKLIKRHI